MIDRPKPNRQKKLQRNVPKTKHIYIYIYYYFVQEIKEIQPNELNILMFETERAQHFDFRDRASSTC